ncbi:MAG: hypothetical protein ACE366_05760 [Bradymonadia bacterium]
MIALGSTTARLQPAGFGFLDLLVWLTVLVIIGTIILSLTTDGSNTSEDPRLDATTQGAAAQ